jgi:hypothetical protein
VASLVADLRADPPALHGAGSEYWGLAWPALAWLEANVRPEMATLETGAGSSTIVFAARGAVHEAISPSADEHGRIRAECERRGISTEQLRFHVGPSEQVLPSWKPRELDLVLVDGAHGFPYPILDWWYLAPHVRVGGMMLLDDAYMPPVAALVDHLRTDPAWAVVGSVGYRTVIVRKLSDELPGPDWERGRVGGHMSFRYLAPAPRAVAAVRHRMFSTQIGLKALDAARRRKR